MKTEEITLYHYLNLGGKLKNVNWDSAYSQYSDINYKQKIISYEDKGEKNNNMPLIHFTFKNGKTHRYAAFWIKIKVDFVLHEKYIK